MLNLLHLKRENILLGVLQVKYIDQPYFHCHFEPTTAFAEYKPLFDEEAKFLDAIGTEDEDSWFELDEKIQELGFSLIDIKSDSNMENFYYILTEKKPGFDIEHI